MRGYDPVAAAANRAYRDEKVREATAELSALARDLAAEVARSQPAKPPHKYAATVLRRAALLARCRALGVHP